MLNLYIFLYIYISIKYIHFVFLLLPLLLSVIGFLLFYPKPVVSGCPRTLLPLANI